LVVPFQPRNAKMPMASVREKRTKNARATLKRRRAASLFIAAHDSEPRPQPVSIGSLNRNEPRCVGLIEAGASHDDGADAAARGRSACGGFVCWLTTLDHNPKATVRRRLSAVGRKRLVQVGKRVSPPSWATPKLGARP